MREPIGPTLLRSICGWLTLMDQGEVPDTVAPVLFGAILIPQRKKDGGLRFVADGTTFRRLASKTISKKSVHLSKKLSPLQLGFATKNGCEADVHAVRAYIEQRLTLAVTHALLKIDMKNAFNCVDRNAILNVAK